ncbi:NUMOD4 motif protein [Bacillus phage vB_BcoS-136]|uniref:NUMOD4 motif protein n=1 Tax=Bacillus phage vB_BcoS-136 TaxID=2419619 RepID=A0A3G3BVE0_9CAUD|nr:NUMOD4 motif protein [Bacillus phage vB_BcoS-136]AYP68222.1 NUMOD4 motif protein [Bacillus phage vB_BcoS-136]
MHEIWKSLKDIVDCGNNYEVSNLGRIRSVDFFDARGYKRKGQIMSYSLTKKRVCKFKSFI